MRLKAFSLAVVAQRNGQGDGERGETMARGCRNEAKVNKKDVQPQLSSAREVAQHLVGSFEGILKGNILLKYINIIDKFR